MCSSSSDCAFAVLKSLVGKMENCHGEVVDGHNGAVFESLAKREKLIIDTDPGIGEQSPPFHLFLFGC